MVKHVLEKHQVEHAIASLGIKYWLLEGEPSNEQEFLNSFTKLMPDETGAFTIESKNPKDFGITWDQIKEELNKFSIEEPLRLLRMERDKRIAETDWWVLGDRIPTQEQLDYRQSLRDITNVYTDYKTVVWPEKP